MGFIEWLGSCYSILFPCGMIISLIQGFKIVKTSTEPTRTSKKEGEKTDNLLIIFNLITMIIIIVGVLYFALSKGYKWLMYIFVVPCMLQYASGTLFSANMVGSIVRSTNANGLSYKEKNAIIMLAAIFWIAEHQGDQMWLKNQVDAIASVELHDLCAFLFYAWKIYVYTFLNCALVSFPAQVLLKLLQKLLQKSSYKWNQLMVFLSNEDDRPTRRFLYVKKFIEYLTAQKRSKRVLGWLIVPFIGIFDFMIIIVVLLVSLLCTTTLHLLLILRFVGRILMRPLEILGGISDRKIVALSFRIAVVSTLIAIVVINRFEPIFKNIEASTAVLEFIASAIIIPLVFEWISSWRMEKTK